MGIGRSYVRFDGESHKLFLDLGEGHDHITVVSEHSLEAQDGDDHLIGGLVHLPQNCVSTFLKVLQRNNATYHREGNEFSSGSEAQTPTTIFSRKCGTHPLGHCASICHKLTGHRLSVDATVPR